MRRWPLISLGIAGLALLLVLVVALFGVPVMPSYLAAWLFWIGLPVGALPLVMALELAGAVASPVLPPLRRLLVLLPAAVPFVLPVLLRLARLYDWSRTPQKGFAGAWFTPGFFAGRAVVFLLIWAVLALVFLRPPPDRAPAGRRGAALLGLVLHAVIGSLAAVDWAMSVNPGLNSSSFGLLLIAAQCGLALSAAILLAGRGMSGTAARQFAALMLVLLGAWIFLHFTQFLVIWSANKPAEVTWYLRRSSGLGAVAEWLGVGAFALPLLLLLPGRLLERAAPVAGAAALVLLAHGVEMLWLVTPASRGSFTISVPDVLAMVAACAAVAGLLGLPGIGSMRDVRP